LTIQKKAIISGTFEKPCEVLSLVSKGGLGETRRQAKSAA